MVLANSNNHVRNPMEIRSLLTMPLDLQKKWTPLSNDSLYWVDDHSFSLSSTLRTTNEIRALIDPTRLMNDEIFFFRIFYSIALINKFSFFFLDRNQIHLDFKFIFWMNEV